VVLPQNLARIGINRREPTGFLGVAIAEGI
jgi:hypothetical protein